MERILWNRKLGPSSAWQWSPTTGRWWTRLIRKLESASVSDAAIDELTRSSSGACGLLPNPSNWKPAEPFFSGVVVGAVQSGKTQHMMSVAARALDNGYRAVVVLAGQTNDLRTQTARRFNSQLADNNEPVFPGAGRTTLGGPLGARSQPSAFCLPYSADAHEYDVLSIKIRRELARGGTILLVIKKHPLSVGRVGEALRAAISAVEGFVPVLVLDDECDDASVPGNAAETVMPGAITALLTSEDSRLKFAYLGYTATAAANLLQDPASPLYPQVVHVLRTPGRHDSDVEYFERDPDKWYCGSWTYFEEFGDRPSEDSNFLVKAAVSEGEVAGDPRESVSLLDALRAFFVGAAFREIIEGPEFFHSAMIHTSQSMGDHKRFADAIAELFGGEQSSNGRAFDQARLATDLEQDSEGWMRWYHSFVASRSRVNEVRPHQAPMTPITWVAVRERLPSIFARARLKIVNSDDDNADRLDYSASFTTDGQRLPPPDQLVVVIGGARLSRGITVEGLTASYFARSAVIRYEDALLQMNRWFGYRSPYLDFCRIFTTPRAYSELRQMAENDELLKEQLCDMMRRQASPADAGLVLRSSPYSKPTAKIGKGREVSISFSPFLKVLGRASHGPTATMNQDFAARFVATVSRRLPRSVRSQTGHELGVVSEGWTAEDVADWLDALQFDVHNPAQHPELHGGTHRPPDPTRRVVRSFPLDRDPYMVAAYLRRWSRQGNAPQFNLAISYGSEQPDPPAFPFPLVNRQLDEDGDMLGGWTGRSEHWPGDIFFDTHEGGAFPTARLRAQGSPGLLLLYLIGRNATGRGHTRGTTRSYHAPFFGISIPDGGPQDWRTLGPGGAL